jgi:hypothetical protein
LQGLFKYEDQLAYRNALDLIRARHRPLHLRPARTNNIVMLKFIHNPYIRRLPFFDAQILIRKMRVAEKWQCTRASKEQAVTSPHACAIYIENSDILIASTVVGRGKEE